MRCWRYKRKLLANVLQTRLEGKEFVPQSRSFHEFHGLRSTLHVALGFGHEFFKVFRRHGLDAGVSGCKGCL